MSQRLDDDTAFIIRRVPPSSEIIDTVITRPDGSVTPTSATLGLRPGERGLSCSQLAITSPEELLSQERRAAEGDWKIAIWRVADLPEGLEVVVTPSSPPDLDPGHCEIRPKAGYEYTKRLQSKLAKAGRIIDVVAG